jgi:hypothetical protein
VERVFESEIAAFWSYAHADEASDGRILKLAQDIEDEYAMISGGNLKVFVDSKSLEWGDAWRDRIDDAVQGAAFFIPIITPRYFMSTECRAELIAFIGTARARGFAALLLPILYVGTEGLDLESPDEAMSIIASTQWEDWTELRLLDLDSEAYRRGVNRLAKRLRDAMAQVSAGLLDAERADLADESGEGLAELVAELDTVLPRWLDAVLTDRSSHAAYNAIVVTHLERYQRLERSHSPAGPKLAIIQRLGQDVLPLVERHAKDGSEYASLCVEMDPLVLQILDMVRMHPDMDSVLNGFREAVEEAMDIINKYEADRESPGESSAGYRSLSRYKSMSRVIANIDLLFERTDRAITEANTIVKKWNAALHESDSEHGPS